MVNLLMSRAFGEMRLQKPANRFPFSEIKNRRFSRDVTKIQTSKLLILLRFYFYDV